MAIMEAIPHEPRWSIMYTMQIASTEAVNKTPSHPIFLCPSSCAVKPDMPNVVQLSHLCMHNSSQSTSVNQDICTNYCNSCRIPAVSADSKRVKECCTHCPYSLILESCRVRPSRRQSEIPRSTVEPRSILSKTPSTCLWVIRGGWLSTP